MLSRAEIREEVANGRYVGGRMDTESPCPKGQGLGLPVDDLGTPSPHEGSICCEK